MPKPDHNGKTFGGDLQRRLALSSDVVVPLDYEHHDSPLRHQFGTSFEAPVSVGLLVPGTASPGSAEMPARADHTHSIASGIGSVSGQNWGAVALTGTIPTSGNVTLGTINIAAAPYDRVICASAMTIFTATAASFYQIMLTMTDGTLRFARGTGGSQDTATINPTFSILPANTAGTLTVIGSWVGGTSAACTTSNDGRYARMDYFALPI